MYKLINIDEKRKTIKILYKNSSNDKNAIFKIVDFIKNKTDNAKVEYKEENIILYSENVEYIFKYIENEYIEIEVIRHSDKVAFEYFKYMEKIFQEYINNINLLENKNVVDTINSNIKHNMWIDFKFLEYNNGDLHIVGSNDLSCYYDNEIIFKNVYNIDSDTYFNACPSEYNVFEVYGFNEFNNMVIKIKPDDSKRDFFITCDYIEYKNDTIRLDYNYESLYSIDKENIIKKYNLIKENNRWYQDKENSHKTMIFTDEFFSKSDTIGVIFRIYKLSYNQVKYFRVYHYNFEPYKYDCKNGFIETELWDCEFLKHIESNMMIDLRYLQTITNEIDFNNFCRELEKK